MSYSRGGSRRQLGDDTELIAKATPTYPPMAKRMLQDNGSWLRCLTQPHVDLVNDPIVDIDATSVRTASGQYEADIIVLATGFRASEVLWPMKILGREGLSIAKVWDGRPAAYNGVSIAGFPNFFVMSGPGTGLAHAGSVIVMSECQMRYIGDALRTLIDGGHRSIEPTAIAYERYRDDLLSEVATLMWGHPSIEHSWYKAADGNVYVLCPWRLVDYWQMTGRVDPDDHTSYEANNHANSAPARSTAAGRRAARHSFGAVRVARHHRLDVSQQELHESIDGVVVVSEGSPGDVGVLEDSAAPRYLVGGQHCPAERIGPVVGQQQRQLRRLRQSLNDVSHHFDQLCGDVHVRGDVFDLRDETAERNFGDGSEQFLGAREVAVDRPTCDAQSVSYVGHSGLRGSLPVDDAQRGVDDPFARLIVVGRWCPSPPFASHAVLTLSPG